MSNQFSRPDIPDMPEDERARSVWLANLLESVCDCGEITGDFRSYANLAPALRNRLAELLDDALRWANRPGSRFDADGQISKSVAGEVNDALREAFIDSGYKPLSSQIAAFAGAIRQHDCVLEGDNVERTRAMCRVLRLRFGLPPTAVAVLQSGYSLLKGFRLERDAARRAQTNRAEHPAEHYREQVQAWLREVKRVLGDYDPTGLLWDRWSNTHIPDRHADPNKDVAPLGDYCHRLPILLERFAEVSGRAEPSEPPVTPAHGAERATPFRPAELQANDAVAAAVDDNPLAKFAHTDDYRSVLWNSHEFTFTGNQAACVRLWWETHVKGLSDVGDETVLRAVDVEDSRRLRDVFKAKGKIHPAWGTMIVEGTTKGTHRLNVPEGETLPP